MQPTKQKPFCQFPDDFLWGVATAAFQVEGASREDGRGDSVWDVACRRPGAIAHGHTGERACDHYHLYKQDVALMKRLGVQAYRFSVAWPRIFPNGPESINPRGVDFYKRLVDELLSAGIQPWMTLFHWDLPQWCEDRYRGWESIDCARHFADYATVMAKAVGDRVAGVFTINEFACFLDYAYGRKEETFAPAKKASAKVLNQARHHAVYGHGLAAQAFRAACIKPPPVGVAENALPAVPAYESDEHVAAARAAFREMTGMFLTPIFEGRYHPAYIEDASADAPIFTDEQMRVISTPLDFLGLNLYTPLVVVADPSAPRGWRWIEHHDDHPRMGMPWLNIGPSVVYWTPRFASELWGPKAIYITENGCATPDEPDARGQVPDIGRIMYLEQHLIHAHRAAAEGYPLKGYFLWSLMDNFEWAHGYTKRFGIVHVNYETMQRTPKLSAEFYAGVIRRNALGGWAVS